ncbi:MAG: hypothetical protein JWQ34_3308 [Mucilaginibacter sp.]|nr:hypothetical protein [Mucilaginibacter sp.]
MTLQIKPKYYSAYVCSLVKLTSVVLTESVEAIITNF